MEAVDSSMQMQCKFGVNIEHKSNNGQTTSEDDAFLILLLCDTDSKIYSQHPFQQ